SPPPACPSLHVPPPPRPLPSFPTRRSSDLLVLHPIYNGSHTPSSSHCFNYFSSLLGVVLMPLLHLLTFTFLNFNIVFKTELWNRSEEHTSELQSRENIVCRLLPEKKYARPS